MNPHPQQTMINSLHSELPDSLIPISLEEYKKSNYRFILTESEFQTFKNLYTKIDKHDTQKLILHVIKNESGLIHFNIEATSYVGIYYIPRNPTLIVKPKLEKCHNESQFMQMWQYIEPDSLFVQYLLANGIEMDKGFIEKFLAYFIQTTYDLLNQNRHRCYKQTIEPRHYLKGQMKLLPTLINRSLGKTEIICQFHHLSMESPINRIIKYTYDFIRLLVPSSCQLMFFEVEQLLSDVDISGFQPNEIEHINWTPLTMPFQPIIYFCNFLLNNLAPTLKEGTEAFPSFCFNAWDIFEKFIRCVLQRHIKENLSIIKRERKIRNRSIVPDILGYDIIYNEYLLVADVKYKTYHASSDYHQMSTYLRELQLQQGVLIYPIDLKLEECPDYKFAFFNFNEWSSDKDVYLQKFTNQICEWKNLPSALKRS